jgi:outer membrane lipoprotein carrier protein
MTRKLPRAALAAFFLKLLTLGLAGAAFATTPAERVKSFVEGTKTFKASFTQTILATKAGRKAQVTSGNVMLSRPGKFRWQVDKPYPQLMVGDGQKVWLHDPDLKQVTVRKIGDALDGTPAALLAGDNAIEKRFALTEGGNAEGLDWVEAVPKGKDASFAKIRLGFRGDLLQAMEMQDSFGQSTTIRFSNVEKNPAIAAAQFKFTPPAGADVVGE